MTRPEPTDADRRNWARGAYQLGYIDPDTGNPHKKGTLSADAWETGRSHRCLGHPMRDLPFTPTALSESFKNEGFEP